MLSRRLARAATGVSTSQASMQAFSTSSVARKHTPSLGDIEPEQHEKFNSRQKQFREQLAEVQKQREASALSSSLNASHARSQQGLGSLSTSSGAGNAAKAAETTPARKSSPLTNLIYGTKEGRELDAQIEASFSQVLARGKYVHSIVFHEVKPESVDEYVDLVGKWYPRMASMPENKVHLVGSWRTEVGDCDTFGEYRRLLRCGIMLTYLLAKCTSGNTSATKATMLRSTRLHSTLSSRHLIGSLGA